MPTYTFINKKSGIEYDEYILLAEYDDYMKKNPDITRVWHGKAPAMVGDHLMGVGPKVDGGFTENMQRIAGVGLGTNLRLRDARRRDRSEHRFEATWSVLLGGM